MSNETLRVRLYPHAFTSQKQEVEVISGASVLELVSSFRDLPKELSYRVLVNELIVPETEWVHYRLMPKDRVTVRCVPNGLIGVLGVAVAGVIGAGLFAGLVVRPLVEPTIPIVSAAIGGGTTEQKDSKGAPAPISRPELRGASNNSAPNGKVPLILGRHAITPYYACPPYTTLGTTRNPGDEMDLNMLFVVGYAPLRLTNFKLGDQLLASNSSASTTTPQDGSVTVDGMFNNVTLEIAQPVSFTTVDGKFTGATTALPAAFSKVVQEQQVDSPLDGYFPIDPANPNDSADPPANPANCSVTCVAANATYNNATTFAFTFTAGEAGRSMAQRGIQIGRCLSFAGFTNTENNNTFVITQVVENVGIDGGIAVCYLDRGRAVNETSAVVLAKTTPANFKTTAENTTSVTALVTLPDGLVKWTNGTKGNYSVTLWPEYRLKKPTTSTQDPWVAFGTEWTAGTYTSTSNVITGQWDSTVRFTATKTGLTAGEYEVRVMRLSPDEAIVEDTTFYDKTTWTSMQSITDRDVVDIESRNQLVLVALKVRASGQISGTVDKFNLLAEAMYPATHWDVTTLATSRKVGDAYRWLLRGPGNPRPVTDDTKIDYTNIDLLTAKTYECNLVLTNPTSMIDTCNGVLRAGYSSFTMRDGVYSFIEDAVKSTISMHITPANSWGFTGSKKFDEITHGLKVKFINEDNEYAQDERIILDDPYIYDTEGDGSLRDFEGNVRTVDGTYIKATNFENVSIAGITSPTAVAAWGRYALAVKKLRPEVFTVNVDAEQVIASRGDRVQVNHDTVAWGTGWGFIKTITLDGSSNVTAITIDNTVELYEGLSYAIRIRTTDNELTSAQAITNPGAGTYTSFTFSTPIAAGSDIAIGNMIQIGELGIESIPCLISAIETYDDLSAKLTLVEYNEDIYTTGTVPAFSSKVTKRPLVTSPAMVVSEMVEQQESRSGSDAAVQAVAAVDNLVPAVVATNAPKYLGRYDHAHPSAYNPGDWWTVYDTDDSPITRGVWYSNAGTPTRITTSSSQELQGKFMAAMGDVAWAEAQGTYGTASDYGISVIFESIGAVTAFIQALFAQTITLLTGGQFKSSGYTPGSEGFSLNDDGSAEFEDVIARGDFTGVVTASQVVIQDVTAGTNIAKSSDAEQQTLEGSYTKKMELQFAATGTINTYFEIKSQADGFSVSGRVYKNSVAVGTERTMSSGTYTGYSEDISVTAGDLIQLYIKTNSAAACFAKLFRLRINEQPGILPFLGSP